MSILAASPTMDPHSDPYYQVRSKAGSHEPHMQQANVVLAAIEEVISEHQQGKQAVGASKYPSATLYFSALMSALDRHPTGETLSSLLYLLSLILPQLNPAILRARYEPISESLLHVITTEIASGDATDAEAATSVNWQQALLKSTVHCVATLLQALDIAPANPQWQQRHTLHLYQFLLVYSLDSRPKIRKSAHHAVQQFLQSITGQGSLKLNKLMADTFYSFVDRELQSVNSKNSTPALYVCNLLQQTIVYLPQPLQIKLLEKLLTLIVVEKQTNSNSILFLQIMKCCHCVCEMDVNEADTAKHMQLIEKLLHVFLALKPSGNDYQAVTMYCFTITTAFIKLALQSSINTYVQLATKYVLLLSEYYIQYQRTVKQSVIIKVTDTILQILYAIPYTYNSTTIDVDTGIALVSSVEALLSYKYKPHWTDCFTICNALVACLPHRHDQLYNTLLTSLDSLLSNAEVYDEFRDDIVPIVETSLVMLGPATVLEILPLNLPTKSTPEADIAQQLIAARSYLLPLFRSVQCTSLEWWIQHIHADLIVGLDQLIDDARGDDHQAVAISLEHVVHQLWDSLPSFCVYATDLKSGVQAFAKVVTSVLQNPLAVEANSTVALIVCKALHNLVRYYEHRAFGKPVDGKSLVDEMLDDARSAKTEFTHKSRFSTKTGTSTFMRKHTDGSDSDDELDLKSASPSARSNASALSRVSILGGTTTVDSTFVAIRRAKPVKLKTLLQQKKQFMIEDQISSDVAIAHLQSLGTISSKLLAMLFNLVLIVPPGDKRAMVLNAIGSLASPSVTDSTAINKMFANVLQKLQQSTGSSNADSDDADDVPEQTEGEKQQTIALSDIMLTLCQYELSATNMSDLMAFVTPLLTSRDSALQKKAYKSLAITCEKHQDTYFAQHWKQVTETVLNASTKLSVSSNRVRLQCVRSILLSVPSILQQSPEAWTEVLTPLIGELLMGLKERSTKCREVAFETLLDLGKKLKEVETIPEGITLTSMSDSDATGSEDHPLLREFIVMLSGGLAGSSGHMQSAATLALARIIYDMYADLSHETVDSLLSTVMALFDSRNRELIKSLLGFTKVCVLRIPADRLQTNLDGIVRGLYLWCDDSKNKFSAKVKLILTILLRKFGSETLESLTPPQHQPLIAYLIKMKEREERQKHERWLERRSHRDDEPRTVQHGQHSGSKGGKTEEFDDLLHGSDSDSEQTTTRPVSKEASKSKSKKRGHEQQSGAQLRDSTVGDDDEVMDDAADPLDMMDSDNIQTHLASNKLRQSNSGGSAAKKRKTVEFGEGVSQGPGGKIVLQTEATAPAERKDEDDDETADGTDVKQHHRAPKRSRTDASEAQKWRSQTGQQYRSGKAGGDVQRKGQLAPHAYVPLDPNALNRRKKHSAARKFESVVTHAKKGAQSGAQRHGFKNNQKR